MTVSIYSTIVIVLDIKRRLETHHAEKLIKGKEKNENLNKKCRSSLSERRSSAITLTTDILQY